MSRGSVQLAQAYFDVGRPDSALVALQVGLRSAADSSLAAQFALARGNALYRSANATKKRPDFEIALRFLKVSDQLAPSPNAGFLIGSAAFSVAQLASTEAAPAKSCPLATMADEHLVLAETRLAKNGAVAPDAAKQFLDFAGQLRPYIAQELKAFCTGAGGANGATAPASASGTASVKTPAP
jgi:hypothetical protein